MSPSLMPAQFDEMAVEEFQNEIRFMQTVRHRNIVLFHGGGIVGNVPFLVRWP